MMVILKHSASDLVKASGIPFTFKACRALLRCSTKRVTAICHFEPDSVWGRVLNVSYKKRQLSVELKGNLSERACAYLIQTIPPPSCLGLTCQKFVKLLSLLEIFMAWSLSLVPAVAGNPDLFVWSRSSVNRCPCCTLKGSPCGNDNT